MTAGICRIRAEFWPRIEFPKTDSLAPNGSGGGTSCDEESSAGQTGLADLESTPYLTASTPNERKIEIEAPVQNYEMLFQPRKRKRKNSGPRRH